ncbi:hypothetical protein C3L33_04399, partial [Rhododendron williamsianum]
MGPRGRTRGPADLDPSEEWAHGGPVGREVGEVPSNQRARCDRSLEASDEWVTIDGLDNLEDFLLEGKTLNGDPEMPLGTTCPLVMEQQSWKTCGCQVRWVELAHFPLDEWCLDLIPLSTLAESRKKRLDELCVERFQQYSKTFIQSWILQGKVFVNGKLANKAGNPVLMTLWWRLGLKFRNMYLSLVGPVIRGGYKLEAAIEQLSVDVNGKVALDSGLSTGGFTDCLLQYGASFVYGVDVGYGQVADKIRHDERVSVVERTNLRYLSGLPQKVDLVTLDLSFISILLVMPAVVNVMKEEATLVTLVKPQFEARRAQVGKGGIVKDPLVHQEVREKIISGVENHGFRCKGWIESPLKGAAGTPNSWFASPEQLTKLQASNP